MTTTLEKRWCFYIPRGQCNDNGYIPSVVTEAEAGHAPLIGSGELSEPWYWGSTYEEAVALARKYNLERGLSDEDVDEIVVSSVAASCRQTTAQERYERVLHPRPERGDLSELMRFIHRAEGL